MLTREAIIIGNIGADAELKVPTNGSKPFVTFSVASSEKQPDGEYITTWVDICLSGQGKENLIQYLTKGKQIYARGTLKTRVYIDKNGQPRSADTIWANKIEFVGGGNNNNQPQAQPTQPAQQLMPTPSVEDESDLPF